MDAAALRATIPTATRFVERPQQARVTMCLLATRTSHSRLPRTLTDCARFRTIVVERRELVCTRRPGDEGTPVSYMWELVTLCNKMGMAIIIAFIGQQGPVDSGRGSVVCVRRV